MSNVKVQVQIPSQSRQDIETAPLDQTKPIINSNQVTDFLTGPTNPLYSVKPPQQTAELQNAVLLQAEDIKKTLERIASDDPTARCHNFPYVIAPENEKLLTDNGFVVKHFLNKVSQDAYTEVCWDKATKWWVTIPLP